MKIYTKTGDKGKTSLIGGTKVAKNNIRIESYGNIDELNCHIGLTIDHLSHEHSIKILREVQDRLFTIGSSLACDPEKETGLLIPDLKESDIKLLETEMDAMNTELEPMKNFILPGGSIAISQAHVSRCVCRRAERGCVNLEQLGSFVEPLIIKYLNRLSDYLFVLARFTGRLEGVPDIPWKPRL